MSSGDVTSTAISGLLAFQRALAITGHNIANVNTAGYNRQRVELVARDPQFTGEGFVGTGVRSQTVTRLYDGFVASQLRATTSTFGELDRYHALASEVDNLFADPDVGLAPALSAFFGSIHDVANDPTSIPARQVMLSEAESLAERFQQLNQQLSDLRSSINTQVTDTVNEINEIAGAIADINDQIVKFQGFAGGQTPNDLYDRRDEMVRELAELVSVSTVAQDDGAMNVFIGSGQSLVVGTNATELDVTRDPYDATRYEVAFSVGATTTIISDNLNGGKLGGVLSFRDEILDTAQNSLGRIAIGMSVAFNEQHQLGMDLNGNLGTEFFDDIDQTSPSVLANTNNAGTGVVAAVVSDVTALTSSDYLLERSGATYTLTRLSDGTATTLSTFPGASEEVDGVTISLSSGAISSGDKFLIQPTRTAARDMGVAITNAALVAAAAPIRTAAASANTGSATVNAGAVDSPPPTDADLTQSVTITFTSATLFNVSGTGTGNPTGVAYTSGNDISYNGWTIKISGTPAAGDVFTVSANTNGYGDSRNANLLTDLQSEEILGSNTTSFTDAYGQVVADIGTKTHSTDINRTAQKSLLDHVIQTRESVSGVNLDEEAADILRFQQAYQAAAQVIAMSDTIFQTLLMAVRR